ncbi:MAG: hypothetical protein CMM01_04240 [Rhodopirellula sp.]|nr:hypothetical protein [Rhodopirellula sp.]
MGLPKLKRDELVLVSKPPVFSLMTEKRRVTSCRLANEGGWLLYARFYVLLQSKDVLFDAHR